MLLMVVGLSTVVFGATNSDLDADFTIQNNAPTIPWVEDVASDNPTEASTTTITVIFNATDTDGWLNIDVSTAQASLSKAGETTRSSASCTNQTLGSNTQVFSCNVDMYFYDDDGSWTITATVDDINSATATNDTTTFTYGTLSAMTVDIGAITFGTTLNLGDNDNGANDTTVLTNTGNQDFTTINVKGQDLVGETTPAETVGASNFEAVTSNTANAGDDLVTNTNVQVTGATLVRGASSTEELWYFLDVPSSGLSAQKYSTTTAWNINVA